MCWDILVHLIVRPTFSLSLLSAAYYSCESSSDGWISVQKTAIIGLHMLLGGLCALAVIISLRFVSRLCFLMMFGISLLQF
jgi:hypothetical protein